MWYLGGHPSGIATWGRGIAWQSRQTQTLLLNSVLGAAVDRVTCVVVVADDDAVVVTLSPPLLISDFCKSSWRRNFWGNCLKRIRVRKFQFCNLKISSSHSVWPDLTKVCHWGKLSRTTKYLKVYLLYDKIFNLLWPYNYTFWANLKHWKKPNNEK